MPCKRVPNSITKVFAVSEIASEKTPKTVYGCPVESHESTWQRVESSQLKNHEDHIAGKGFTSISHYDLVHKFIPMPAVDQEWKKLQSKGLFKNQSGSGMPIHPFENQPLLRISLSLDRISGDSKTGPFDCRDDPSMAIGESQEQEGGHPGSTKRQNKKVHFATLMDTCHLKNAELEPKLQKYKGRVVFRDDIVKDDSWSLRSFY